MTTAEEMIERAGLAIAVSDGCGLTINGTRTLCDDHYVDPRIRATFCACRASARAACAVAVEMCAEIARHSCLVPPDGGSPTEEECCISEMCASRLLNIATAIKGE